MNAVVEQIYSLTIECDVKISWINSIVWKQSPVRKHITRVMSLTTPLTLKSNSSRHYFKLFRTKYPFTSLSGTQLMMNNDEMSITLRANKHKRKHSFEYLSSFIYAKRLSAKIFFTFLKIDLNKNHDDIGRNTSTFFQSFFFYTKRDYLLSCGCKLNTLTISL